MIKNKLESIQHSKSFWRILKHLRVNYGYQNTLKTKKPVDSKHKPLPWFTYPAIEYISQLDLSDKYIFEWGAGNSSTFFSNRCKKIISVENNQEWYEYTSKDLRPNQEILFREQSVFAESIEENSAKYDLIIIDSLRRCDCAKKALNFLSPGGIIILDNSDWHPNASSVLRERGNLIEVDMHGFGPINTYSWTTSLYFHREFKFKALGNTQPSFSNAAIQQRADDDTPSSTSI